MRDMYASGDIRDWHHLHEDPDWAEQYIVVSIVFIDLIVISSSK
jgi:hypothetical protein